MSQTAFHNYPLNKRSSLFWVSFSLCFSIFVYLKTLHNCDRTMIECSHDICLLNNQHNSNSAKIGKNAQKWFFSPRDWTYDQRLGNWVKNPRHFRRLMSCNWYFPSYNILSRHYTSYILPSSHYTPRLAPTWFCRKVSQKYTMYPWSLHANMVKDVRYPGKTIIAL